MIKLNYYFLLVLLFSLWSCKQPKSEKYNSENLKVERLTAHTFRHISYLSTESFGNVACNGLVIIDGDEALIVDTPVDETDSKDLINWVEQELNCQVIGVVVTHFHADCLGGLKEFHRRGIPSYASFQTIDFAKKKNTVYPKVGFNDRLELTVGNEKVINSFCGEGHTSDNIVTYFPTEKVLFGGCLIKEIDASKGNLDDSNVADWSATVRKVQTKFHDAEMIVPGHGQPGDQGLLDYTIKLFQAK